MFYYIVGCRSSGKTTLVNKIIPKYRTAYTNYTNLVTSSPYSNMNSFYYKENNVPIPNISLKMCYLLNQPTATYSIILNIICKIIDTKDISIIILSYIPFAYCEYKCPVIVISATHVVKLKHTHKTLIIDDISYREWQRQHRLRDIIMNCRQYCINVFMVSQFYFRDCYPDYVYVTLLKNNNQLQRVYKNFTFCGNIIQFLKSNILIDYTKRTPQLQKINYPFTNPLRTKIIHFQQE